MKHAGLALLLAPTFVNIFLNEMLLTLSMGFEIDEHVVGFLNMHVQ
jgi:hypothetical protein